MTVQYSSGTVALMEMVGCTGCCTTLHELVEKHAGKPPSRPEVPAVLVNEEWLSRQPIHRLAGEQTACGVHPRWQVLVTTTDAALVTCQECKRA